MEDIHAKLKPGFTATPCKLTPQQQTKADALQIKMLRDHPFFAFILIERLKVIWTKDVETAATDGFWIYFNPDWLLDTKALPEQIFVYCHEICHAIYEHMQRAKAHELIGAIRGIKFNRMWANVAQDFRINEDLKKSGVGQTPKDALIDPQIKDEETWEAVYARLFKNIPPPSGSGKAQGSSGQGGSGSSNGQSGPRGTKGQGFDDHLPPPVDAQTNKPVEADATGMKEAVLQAAGHAKAQGKMPAGMQRMVDELRAPKVSWQDHIRHRIQTMVGSAELSYQRPHRRRIAIGVNNMQMVWPGLTGFATGIVWIGGDTSGSMGRPQYTAACSEVQGILVDCRPKLVRVAWCDAKVHRVDELRSVEDLADKLCKGIPGGGGTDFRPVFDRIEEEGGEPPCALVFITDGYGTFPKRAPSYPVIWCMVDSDVKPPFGDVTKITTDDA